MELNKTQSGNIVKIAISGIIDTDTSRQLGDELLKLDYTDLDLTLDFSNTAYITSAGLRVLLVARKKLSFDSMRLINVNDEIADVFEMTGFAEMFNFKKQGSFNEDNLKLSFKAMLKNKVCDFPDKTAFVFADRNYTWKDIDEASQIIAVDLSKAGVKKGSHVGICSVNSINWIFTFFAVQKLGGIAVLMNFNSKPNEIASLSIIGDVTHLCYAGMPGYTDYNSYTNAVMNIAECKIKSTYDISSNVDFTLRFHEYPAIKDAFPEMYHADDASVVIFSSGSTGKPKAVLLSSYNLFSSVLPLVSEFQFNNSDRNCAFLPLFHVFGFTTAISVGLLCNITSYIPSAIKPSALISIIEKYQCTLFHTVPTAILAMIQDASFSPERLSSLRASVLGGSATTEAQMSMLQKLLPGNHFGNVYGMSENAAISITKYEDTVEHITQTVGKPVDGVEIEIRDVETKKPLSKGMPGEIYIRSSAMVVCYYKLDIDLQPLDDEGWLSTGDLGYIDDNDGYLHLVGRVKDLIIRGGENISPAEVADSIALLPEIADVKVLGVPNELYGEDVAAAIILKPGAQFDSDKAKSELKKKLSSFKVPAYFVKFAAFPLLGSGKIDALKIKSEVIDAIKNGCYM